MFRYRFEGEAARGGIMPAACDRFGRDAGGGRSREEDNTGWPGVTRGKTSCVGHCREHSNVLAYVAEREAGWTNSTHSGQWTSTLETCAKPVQGDLRVDRIETEHILTVLRPT